MTHNDAVTDIKHLTTFNKLISDHFLACNAFESQSIAESKPSPFVAEVLKIWKVLFLRFSNPKAWCTSATVRQPCMSCLFAKTTSIAPFSSSS